MAEKMYAITPSIGVPLTQTHAKPMVQPGSKAVGHDGHDYIYVQNGASPILTDTAVILTEPEMTVAAGAGDFETIVAVPASEYCWVRRSAI